MSQLDQIRSQIALDQEEILSTVWRHKLSTGEWIPTRLLHKSGGGKRTVQPLLSKLGGSVIFEIEDPELPRYGLSLLGVLLSKEGSHLEDLLARYLSFVRKLVFDDPLRTSVDSKEVAEELGLSDEEVSGLGILVFSSPLSAGGTHSRERWSARIPSNIEDLPDDAVAYVEEVALDRYDPATPILARERQALQVQHSQPAPKNDKLPPLVVAAAEVTDHDRGASQAFPGSTPFPSPHKFETALETYARGKILGEGGSGRVLLVKDSKGSIFAIKYLRPELLTSAKLSRFKNELSFSMKNTHPNILSIVDQGFTTIDGSKVPFYVMPVYPTTLRRQIAEGIAPEVAFEVFLRILDGLEVAHQRGIWHRDLKPENILMDLEASKLAIADFGIAHFSKEELFSAVETQRADRLANFQYAAPEQRKRGGHVDFRADIYALGMILNELFTGITPLGTEFRKVSEASPTYAFLDPVIDRMMRQSPNHRHGSVNEIRLELMIGQQSQAGPGPLARTHEVHGGTSSQLKAYRAEVDTVGRIDDASADTVMCVSAGLSYSVLLPAQEKARALAFIADLKPQWGTIRPRVLLYSLLLYLLLKDQIGKLDVVAIDPEYEGYEPEIKGLLLRLLRSDGRAIHRSQVIFERIDRQSPARTMASRVYKRQAEPDLLVGPKAIADVLLGGEIGGPSFTNGRRR